MKPAAFDPRVLFREDPGLYVVLDPDLKIVDASTPYLRATMTWRRDLLHQWMFDVFPDNPADPESDATTNLRASLEEAMTSGLPASMSAQKYDVRDRVSGRGEWVEKYWRVVNIPVFRPSSAELHCVVHRVQDITDLVLARSRIQELQFVNAEQRSTLVAMLRDLRQREEELRATDRRLQRAMQSNRWQAPDEAEIWTEELHGVPSPVFLGPGDRAGAIGVFLAIHEAPCAGPRTHFVMWKEDPLPACHGCGDKVRYVPAGGFRAT